MAASYFKGQVTANDLAQRLKLRLAAPYVITQSFDASNNPCVLVQSAAGQLGTDSVLIQVTGSVSTYSNLIGGSEDFASSPTILNTFSEAITTTNTLGTASITLFNSASFQAAYETELVKVYGIQNVFAVNKGVTISVAALANTLTTAVTLVSTVVPELQSQSGMAAG